MANEHRSGPVRSTAAREAILDATSRLFHAQGYDRLTIEGIAKEAGVGKQTIYRWWSSRGALIADCLVDGRLIPVDFVVPDTGDLFADVETWLQSVFSILASAQGQALLQSLVAAAAEDAAVGAHLGSSLGVEQHLSERLRGGIRDGQLPEDAPVAQIGRAILGAIIVDSLGRESRGPDGIIDLARYLFTR
ncbi:TetR/AcrR family transcriptional regulator [Microbacterium oxydans]|jgi:AcrR family transcriptional regulator|uniref:TetR/AcrR family transcriptional regulator n=1 Tax=Microbacterium TaxID=33882 RepID=UPI000DE43AB2|nr:MULTISPECIES: TetR/AcrR family transcriptional regulator [unclassified Microbacterium]MBE7955331.1 TetR/AcrR family transcriptional regulator [Microbacterium sp. R1]MCB8045133.1 TetR/AcrR family transcriptional regulator [Microbacterium oxydans]NYF30332.1 AcrR family transcriptional regulator [Microbacterium sp. JAI119]RBO70505.1 TetR family transcriptional regulator [Microbacterium sp. H6]